MLLKIKYPIVYEKSKAGFDLHLSDAEVNEFYQKAKELQPKTVFTLKGCIDCINSMVALVFAAEDKGEKTIKADGLEQKKEK